MGSPPPPPPVPAGTPGWAVIYKMDGPRIHGSYGYGYVAIYDTESAATQSCQHFMYHQSRAFQTILGIGKSEAKIVQQEEKILPTGNRELIAVSKDGHTLRVLREKKTVWWCPCHGRDAEGSIAPPYREKA